MMIAQLSEDSGGLVKVQNLKNFADVINENLQKKTLSTEFCPSFPSPHSNNPLGRHLLLAPAVPPEAHVVPRVDLLPTPGDGQGVLSPETEIYISQGTILNDVCIFDSFSLTASAFGNPPLVRMSFMNRPNCKIYVQKKIHVN